MTWDAATTVVVPSFTLLQILGDGKSHWAEVAFTWDSTHLEDADGTSRDGASGADDGVPSGWGQNYRGILVDWGDGSEPEGISNIGLFRVSTSTYVGMGSYFNEAGPNASFLPTHRYADSGTYTITAIALLELSTFDLSTIADVQGSSVLCTFTTGSAAVPDNTRPMQKLVAMCANLNDGSDAGNFYDAQFIASAPFSTLRASGAVPTTRGFHGMGARDPWENSPGRYYGYGFTALGTVGHDIWALTDRGVPDGASTPDELAIWPARFDDTFTRIVDGGPTLGATDPADYSVENNFAGNLGGNGLLVALNNVTGDAYTLGRYRVRSYVDGSTVDTGIVPGPDWRPGQSVSGGAPDAAYHWDIMRGLNDSEVLMAQSGNQFYGGGAVWLPLRHYISNIDTGECWLAYDLHGTVLTVLGVETFLTWDAQRLTISQSSDGAFLIGVRTFTYVPGIAQSLLVLGRDGLVKGTCHIPNAPAGGTPTGDFTGYSSSFTALLDPGDSNYVYVPVYGPNADSDALKVGIYRVDITDGSFARVVWFRHPYDDAIDIDGSQWAAWDYVDHLIAGDPLDGHWLPPGPGSRVQPPLRQFPRNDGLRRTPGRSASTSRQGSLRRGPSGNYT